MSSAREEKSWYYHCTCLYLNLYNFGLNITFVIFNALEYKGNTNFRTTKYLQSGSLFSGQGYLVSTIQEHHLPVYLLLLLLLWQLPLLHMEGNVPAQHDLLKTLYSYDELLFPLHWNNDHSLHQFSFLCIALSLSDASSFSRKELFVLNFKFGLRGFTSLEFCYLSDVQKKSVCLKWVDIHVNSGA